MCYVLMIIVCSSFYKNNSHLVAVYRIREGQTVARVQFSCTDLIFIAFVIDKDYNKVSSRINIWVTAFDICIVETRLDTAEGDKGGGGEDDVDRGEAHGMDTRSNTENLACKTSIHQYK